MASCWAGCTRQTVMAIKRFHQSGPRTEDRLLSKGLAEDVAVIHSDFADYLRARHYAPLTVDHYQRRLVHVACWLREHPRHPALRELTRRIVPHLLAQVLPRSDAAFAFGDYKLACF